jgi:energy-coupling factor transporter transmembrane protein EcfT
MYEAEVEKKGAVFAAITMVILATVYYCYEIFTAQGQNYALYSIIAIYCSVLFGYKGIKLEKKRGFNIFCSIVWLLVTILTIVQYFRG